MSSLELEAGWPNIPAWDETTDALGTTMNAPAAALGARTEFLKEEITAPSGNDPLGGFSTYDKLRAYRGKAAGAAKRLLVGVLATAIPMGIYGQFAQDPADTTTADNGATVVVDADGVRWKRVYQGGINPEWAGAVFDGITDDRAAINKAIAVAALAKKKLVTLPDKKAFISGQIVPAAGMTIKGGGEDSGFLASHGNMHVIWANETHNVKLKDFSIDYASKLSTTAYFGAIVPKNSNRWNISGITIENMGHWGIVLNDSSDCVVRDCEFAGECFTTLTDSAAIGCYRNSKRNRIAYNKINVNSWHGVMMQDPYAGTLPTENTVIGNEISGSKCYGILGYITYANAVDTRTKILYNKINGILGGVIAQTTGHSGGSGIYLQKLPGSLVRGNTVWDCCKNTTNFDTLATGCIAVANDVDCEFGVTLSDNDCDATRGPCIAITTNKNPIKIAGGTLIARSSEAGTNSRCIHIKDATDVEISHVSTNQTGTLWQAVSASYSAVNAKRLVINGGTHNAKTGSALYIAGTSSTAEPEYVGINGGHYVTEGTAAGIFMTFIQSGTLTGVRARSSGGAGLQLTSAKSVRGAANVLSGSIYGIATAGVCTNTFFDDSNSYSVHVNNAGTGSRIDRLSAESGSASGWAQVGDRISRFPALVGQPRGWICTAAGNGSAAVFTAEAVL